MMVDANSDGVLANGLGPRVAWARMALGLVQGLVLYVLMRVDAEGSRLASHTYWGLVTFMVGFLLLLVVLSLGHLSKRQLPLWVAVSTAVMALLGGYDLWRREAWAGWPSFELMVDFVLGFYIAQAMVLAGANEQQKVASYNGYFEQAWKVLIQALLSLLFLGVVWLVLWMGASLFGVLGLTLLRSVLGEPWFFLPVSCFALATGMHITDVKPSVIRNIRTLLLTLFAWLLPLATLFVAGFLAVLPWTGFELLWATGHATWILLGTVLLLILLINAAYQNGLPDQALSALVRTSARVAALCLLPVVLIAMYALGLRVADYGWTNDRLVAAIGVGLSLSYAVGYAWAATRQDWLGPVARVNIFNAFLFLAVLLVVHSPLGDVRRLSVNHQMARLNTGKVSAQDFDYRYLKFQTDRYGREALAQLSKRTEGPEAEVIREKATEAMDLEHEWSDGPKLVQKTAEQMRADLHVWPQGAALPDDLTRQNWQSVWRVPVCLTRPHRQCDVFRLPSQGRGAEAWLLMDVQPDGEAVIVKKRSGGQWDVTDHLPRSVLSCQSLIDEMKAGHWQMVNKVDQDLMIGNQRFVLSATPGQPAVGCGQ
jgi:hypothetical protein